MLISLTLENWMSFRDKVTFSMVASRERQHVERISAVPRYKAKVLPIAAIFGGNASGKTNFFKALHFARFLVVRGTHPESQIPVLPFRLDAESSDRPSSFLFELLCDETIYEFSFSVTQNAVLRERLVEISPASEKVLYDRRDGRPNFDRSLKKDKFLEFAFQGTRENQLFLTNAVSQKVDHFRPVYDWFNQNLILIAPDSRFGQFDLFFDEGHPLYSKMKELLSQLDTGISHLGSDEIPFEHLPVPELVKAKLREDVREGTTVRLIDPPKERFVVTRKEGHLLARKLVAFHSTADGMSVRFDIGDESDGSQRVIDLLPAFVELIGQSSKKIFVVDELDRSLHAVLTRQLIEIYLSTCSAENRSQLLFTTHDLLLLDQDLLRRDEMWITEREATGVTTLLSISEYKDVRSDKDIRKSYLQGRMGGIPRLDLAATAAWSGHVID